jgi:hypothetical protein
VEEKGNPSWRAMYQTRDGKVNWDVDVESLACPVSVITPESKQAVGKFYEARATQKLGGTMYGPDASLWPARWHNTVTLLQHEIEREEAAATMAINARRTT